MNKPAKLLISMLMTVLAAGCTSGNAPAATASSAAATSTPLLTEASPTGTQPASTGLIEAYTTPTDNILSYTVDIGGDVFTLPMPYSQVADMGWTINGEEKLSPDTSPYLWLDLQKGDVSCKTKLILFEQAPDEFYVYALALDVLGEAGKVNGAFELPTGLKSGESTKEDVLAQYKWLDEGEAITGGSELVYGQDIPLPEVPRISMTFDEEGVLYSFWIQNGQEPRFFGERQVADTLPDEVSGYVAPADMGGEEEGVCKLGGQLYTLPLPVSTLLADGWQMDKDPSAVVYSDEHVVVWFTKEGTTISGGVYNGTEEILPLSNLPLSSISVEDTQGDFELPRGIHPGMAQAELEQALAGLDYRQSTSDKDGAEHYHFFTVEDDMFKFIYQMRVVDGVVDRCGYSFDMRRLY